LEFHGELKFEQVRRVVEHEDNLINHRFSWLIAAQSLLLAGWAQLSDRTARTVPLHCEPATALRSYLAQDRIALVGLASALFTYVSIWAAIIALERLRTHEPMSPFQDPFRCPRLTSPTWRHRLGLLGPVAVPPAFAALWIVELWHFVLPWLAFAFFIAVPTTVLVVLGLRSEGPGSRPRWQ
jgi:hypothetical protein